MLKKEKNTKNGIQVVKKRLLFPKIDDALEYSAINAVAAGMTP